MMSSIVFAAVFAGTDIATLSSELSRWGLQCVARLRVEEIIAAGVAELGRVIALFSAELGGLEQEHAALRLSLQTLAATVDRKFAELDGAKEHLKQKCRTKLLQVDVLLVTKYTLVDKGAGNVHRNRNNAGQACGSSGAGRRASSPQLLQTQWADAAA